jgi:membrane-bound lytic murein transglycosylase B
MSVVRSRETEITRRRLLLFAASTAWVRATPAFAAGFGAFLQSLWPEAQAKGVRRETFESVVAGLTPDESLPKTSGGQPEFDKPLQTYYREAVGAGRIAKGRALAGAQASALSAGESRFGVPGEICLAAWAMESDFGRSRGTRDIVRTLATLAFTRLDRPVFRDEFVAALLILDRGLSRDRLVGSWAGAMGDPQFLPSAYLKYAVSASGGATPDIWTNPADVLASIASFLRAEGWVPGQPWIEDVILPQGFGFPTLHASAAEWAALGLRRPDGRQPAGEGDASLFLPSGANGPAFLLFPNYFVIKQYNNSDSYALSLGSLAQRIAGAPAQAVPWPAKPTNLSRTDKAFIQAKLAGKGLYTGPRDGKFGPKARDAIHAYQKAAGLAPADGFATPALVAALRAGR